MWFAGPFPWLWGIHLYMAERSFVYEGKKSAFLNWSKSLQFISWHADNEWQHLAHVPLNMTGTPFSGEDKLKCPAASLYGLPWWLNGKARNGLFVQFLLSRLLWRNETLNPQCRCWELFCACHKLCLPLCDSLVSQCKNRDLKLFSNISSKMGERWNYQNLE